MVIDFSQFTMSLSLAIDFAEKAFLNVMPYHGMRVAAMTAKMAEYVGYSETIKYSLIQAAMLHDCALSEYISDELKEDGSKPLEIDMSAHCIAGERMLNKLPLYENVHGAVLYHHDRADGKGALKKTSDHTPLYAQLIHIADCIDVNFDLYSFDSEKYVEICNYVKENIGTIFSKESAEAFLNSVDIKTFKMVEGEKAKTWYESVTSEKFIDVSLDLLCDMASVFAEITDYKSHFTWRHSMGIAQKAEIMGEYYGLSEDECKKLYIAGALHDIGKLLISNDILEKPGKLTTEEYKEIQNHAVGTWELLHKIAGMEDISMWASLHHEKLDGSGYPFKYTKENLDKNSRLLACLDIYQALVEDRPYKTGMSHEEAMAILNKMGDAGQLDATLISDIDSCFAKREEHVSHMEIQKEEKVSSGISYRCPVCGYVYEGDTLPSDFICPRCEQPGTIFEKQ